MKRLFLPFISGLLLVTTTAAAPAVSRSGTSTYSGSLYHGESGVLDLTLYQGTTYTYRGSCDLYCRDLDFAIQEWVPPYNGRRGYWRFVFADRAPDDTPSIRVTPGYSTTFRLTIIMSRCNDEPCDYSVSVIP